MPKSKTTLRDIINNLIEIANTNTRRLRVLEEKTENLITQLSSLQDNILTDRKKINKMISGLSSDISKQDERITRMEKITDEIIKQFKKVATESKIKELEELIELYNPLKSNFVTREEVERMIEEKMEE
jgi:hypothetical protein